jgi:hypothetical protein
MNAWTTTRTAAVSQIVAPTIATVTPIPYSPTPTPTPVTQLPIYKGSTPVSPPVYINPTYHQSAPAPTQSPDNTTNAGPIVDAVVAAVVICVACKYLATLLHEYVFRCATQPPKDGTNPYIERLTCPCSFCVCDFFQIRQRICSGKDRSRARKQRKCSRSRNHLAANPFSSRKNRVTANTD